MLSPAADNAVVTVLRPPPPPPERPLRRAPRVGARASGVAFTFASGLASGLALALGLALSAAPAAASEATLLKLAETNRITLGANDDALPLAYLYEDRHIGFHLDVCLRIVDMLRQRFDLPRLQVATVVTTQATRLSMLHNGSIDIACGHNPVGRAAEGTQRLYSHATLVMPTGAMALTTAGITSLQQLQGKRVSTAVGDVALSRLRALLRKRDQQVTLVPGRTGQQMFEQLRNGLADLMLAPEPYLLGYRAASNTPERFEVLDERLGADPVALMFRASDEALVELANEVIDGMMRNGEMERLYRQWFLQPVPGVPSGIGWALEDPTRALYAEPGSESKGL